MIVPWHEEQISCHGLAARIIGVRSIDAYVANFVPDFADNRANQAVREVFCRQTRQLVEVDG